MSGRAESLLIITGTMGSGKSAVLAEASDLLAARSIEHAAIDLDQLEFGHFPRGSDRDRLMYRNLRAVWANYARAGLRRLLLATAVEDRAQLDHCLRAVGASGAAICRLVASLETMQQRVRAREQGVLQQTFVDRVRVLNELLDNAHLEDFTIGNERRSITEVARETLARAGWIAGSELLSTDVF